MQAIITRPNDVEQPIAIVEKMQWGAALANQGVGVSPQLPFPSGAAGDASPADGTGAGRGPWTWPAYDEATDCQNPDGSFPTVALHYAINRPVAAAWGESTWPRCCAGWRATATGWRTAPG